MSYKISDKDKKAWENFLSSKESVPDKDTIHTKSKNRDSFTYDLHGYSLDEANRKVKDLIHESYNKGITKLLIVTGKGLHSENDKNPFISKDLSILKNSVPDFIMSNSELMTIINEIKPAEIEDGGSGAFYIFLKKKIIK